MLSLYFLGFSSHDNTFPPFIKILNDVKKIQYFLAFNDMEFTVYYKEGTTKVIYVDSLDNLREYIENNGYNEGKLFIFIGIIIIFICVGIYGITKEISKQILNKLLEEGYITKEEFNKLMEFI